MKKLTIIIIGLCLSITIKTPCIGKTFNNSSPTLIITELMPNPKGTDKGQEWVEMYNTTEQRIDLSNWKLDNGKIFEIPESLSVPPKSYLILQGENLKITLKNSNSYLSLIDPSNKIVQKIPYKKTTESQSYSLTNIKTNSGTKYSWTYSTPTKGTSNSTLYLLEGVITTPPSINKNFYFEISVHNKLAQIIFSEKKFNFELLQNTLIKNSKGLFLIGKDSNKLNLINFKITKSAQLENFDLDKSTHKTANTKHYWLLFPISILTISLIYLSIPKATSLPS